MIPYGRQHLDDDDITAVVEVLKGDWLTQGPHVEKFESALAKRVEAKYAVAFANGTAALHAACAVARMGPGDVGATSALTFAASANCLLYVGADVRILDIDLRTLNLDPERAPADVDALVAVHYAGLPVDLRKLAYRPRVVIEDAAHALGAETPDGPVGNCAHSDMCVFSFHPVKHVTTGEGGAVTTNSDELAEALRRFRNHGIVKKPEQGGWYYEVEETGFNYRITDIQAALGTSQLGKLDRFVMRRRELADRYRDRLSDTPIVLPPDEPEGFTHAYHLFPIRVSDRHRVYDEMQRAGIGVQVHYVPLHQHPHFQTLQTKSYPHASAAYDRLLSLPLFPRLTTVEQDRVIDTLVATL